MPFGRSRWYNLVRVAPGLLRRLRLAFFPPLSLSLLLGGVFLFALGSACGRPAFLSAVISGSVVSFGVSVLLIRALEGAMCGMTGLGSEDFVGYGFLLNS